MTWERLGWGQFFTKVGDEPNQICWEHCSFFTTLAHMRVALGTWEGMWPTIKGVSCMRTLGQRTHCRSVGLTSHKRVHDIGERVLSPIPWLWQHFNLGGWVNPYLTHVHPCAVEHSMWGCLTSCLLSHLTRGHGTRRTRKYESPTRTRWPPKSGHVG